MKRNVNDDLFHWGYGEKWKTSTNVFSAGELLTIDNLNTYMDCGEKKCIYEHGCYKHQKESLRNAAGQKVLTKE